MKGCTKFPKLKAKNVCEVCDVHYCKEHRAHGIGHTAIGVGAKEDNGQQEQQQEQSSGPQSAMGDNQETLRAKPAAPAPSTVLEGKLSSY